MARSKYYKMMAVAAKTCKQCNGTMKIGWSEDPPYGDTYVGEYIEIDCPYCDKRVTQSIRYTPTHLLEEEEIPF